MTLETRQAFLASIERTHGRHLRRYLAVRMRNARSDVADLTQEVYLRLLRIEDHETIRNPQAYLFTIASHVLHQHSLRQAAMPTTDDVADVFSELQSLPDTDPVSTLESEQRLDAIGRALFEHSPRAYATLVLHRCDGMALQAIADRFGVSYRMTKKYLASALHFVKCRIDESAKEAP